MRKTTIEPGKIYHVFNRGNERNNIFFEQENYLFFLRRHTLERGLDNYLSLSQAMERGFNPPCYFDAEDSTKEKQGEYLQRVDHCKKG